VSDERCPNCGGGAWSTLLVVRAHEIARCRACDLVRTLGAIEDAPTQYPVFDQSPGPAMWLLRQGTAQLLRERARLVGRLAPAGRLLDFGCGSGAFARLMARRGYDVVGIEPFSLGNPAVGERLRLLRVRLESVEQSIGSFDVITLWQVLEHVADPGALLVRLVRLVAPGGIVIVSVPNFASWQRRLFDDGWFHLDPPRHITHFEPHTLRAVLGRAGLDIVLERTFHLEYGPIGWLQSALNRLVPRPNFLYEFVKDRGALGDLPAGVKAVNLAASVAGAAALAAPSLAVELAAAWRRAGAVITFVARASA